MKGNQSQSGQTQNASQDTYGAQAPQGQPNYQTPPPQQTQPQQQPQQAPVGGAPRGPSGGLAGLISRNRLGNSSQTGGRDVSELAKKFQEYYDREKQNVLNNLGIRIVPVPRQSVITADQRTNSIGMILMIMDNGQNTYTHHTLLVASDMSAQAPTRTNDMYNYNQVQVAAPRTPATIADDALAEVIEQRVRQLVPQGTIISADWSDVPVDFKIADDVAVETLFLNCARACYNELQLLNTDFRYGSLAEVANDGILVNAVHFNQDQANPPVEQFNAAHLPVRSEIIASLRSEQPRQQSRDATENTSGVMDLGNTLAFVSLNIDPAPGRANRFQGTGGEVATQEYSAELVIAGLDMALAPDLGNVLLQISTITAALNSQDRPWLRSLMPRHLQHNGGNTRNENFRPRDLGALNYDYGLKTPVAGDPTRSEIVPFPTNKQNEFGMDNFYALVNSIIQTSPALAIDCPLAGSETWFLRVFACASEDPAAARAIVEAMDALTDGRFSQHFFKAGSTGLVVFPRTERILNGHFPGPDGRPVDVRVAQDLLYLMNAKGHEDPEIGRRYAATFNGSNDAQLAARASIIESAVHNVTWTGVSLRKYITPDFVRAMDASFAETGLKPRIDIAQQDNRLAMRTPYGLMQQGALMTNFVPTMFSNGPTYGNNSAGYRTMAHQNRRY